MEKNIYDFSRCHEFTDPVFTINEQFLEVLKQHNFHGDFDGVISDAIRSVSLDEGIFSKHAHELSEGMKQNNHCNGITSETEICNC